MAMVRGQWPTLLSQLGVTRDLTFRWTLLLGQFFTAQTLTQVLGLLAGLLLVRFMPVEEFALYTLAFSVISFYTFLTDLGAGNSVLYFFNESKRDPTIEFPAFVRAVLSLRAAAFVAGGLLVAMLFPRVALAQAHPTIEVILVTAGIVLCSGFQITAALSMLLLRIRGQLIPSYRAEIAGGLVRLVGSATMVATGWLVASLGVFVAALASAAVTLVARVPPPRVETVGAARVAVRRVLRYLLPTLPSGLYFSIQGPLVIWLASYFGGVTNVAEVGALARLAMIFSVFNNLVGVLFLPRLAHVVDDRLYAARYGQYSAFLAAIGIGLIGAAAFFPAQLLWIVGPNYDGLHRELLISIATAAISLLNLFAVSVALARAWTRWNVIVLALHVTTQILLIVVLRLDTTAGVLTFGLLTATAGLVLQSINNGLGFLAPHLVRWKA